jgi:hypothetical protein
MTAPDGADRLQVAALALIQVAADGPLDERRIVAILGDQEPILVLGRLARLAALVRPAVPEGG